MLNLIFYTLFFALFVNFSFGSLRFSQINRAFMSSYKGLFETCIATIDEEGDAIYPYFDRELLIEETTKYFETNVGKYTKDYALSIAFYDDDLKAECSYYDYARTVKLSLKANINLLFTYNKEQFFTITDRDAL